MFPLLPRKLFLSLVLIAGVLHANTPVHAEIGLWTSEAELSTIPMSGPAWDNLLSGANQPQGNPDVANQDDNTNVYVLASAIVYARTGALTYRNKVVNAITTLVNRGNPGGRTLAWARETGAYVLAADLVDYRTPEFETWLRNIAEVWVGTDGRTLLDMFKERPNNWGTHAFGTLCAIYGYLQDSFRLVEVRNYWIQGVIGPNPGYSYGADLSWHLDTTNLRQINPAGAVKNGMNIDGVFPDDLRRGGSFKDPPAYTGYVWEAMQGLIMGARVLDRLLLPVWQEGDSAVYRAAYALQVRFAALYGTAWQATGDDAWMLPFLDKAYGVSWSNTQDRLWDHGKNAGWGYVTLAQSSSPVPAAAKYTLTVNTFGSGTATLDPPGGSYDQGTVVTLTAVPSSGWRFDSWFGDVGGSRNPETIVMDANKDVTARFKHGKKRN